MNILAHRGNLTGPDPARENTLERISLALAAGFGVETDIRRAAQGFYISHDVAPFSASADASRHAALWRRYPRQAIALNVKELGAEKPLIEFLSQTETAFQVFLFDLELLEAEPGVTAALYSRLAPHVRLAARVSDRDEPVDGALANRAAGIVWLDEFDRRWAGADDVARLHDAGKSIYAVSPELHGFSFSRAQSRWDDFMRWGIAGVCTDFPVALRQHMTGSARSVGAATEVSCSASS
jgi:glycerophosphoryl diester phosphodiesterase